MVHLPREDPADIRLPNTVPSRTRRLLAAPSWDRTVIQVWNVQTGQLVAPPIRVEAGTQNQPGFLLAISPDERVVAYMPSLAWGIRVRDICTGALVSGPWHVNGTFREMNFSADGKQLVLYEDGDNFSIWDTSDLSEPNRPVRGFRDDSHGRPDGWVVDKDGGLLFWVPVDHRRGLYWPRHVIVKASGVVETKLDLTNFKFGENWQEYYKP